jgi:aspartate racemase
MRPQAGRIFYSINDNMKMIKSIGVLGGMGPAASAHFYKQLVHHAQTTYQAIQDNQFPKMVIYSLPLDGFEETGITNDELVKQQILNAAQTVEATGVDALVMVCNTAHAYEEELNNLLNIPLLNIIETTSLEAKRFNLKNIGIMSSSTTREMQLYETKLKEQQIKTIHVNDVQQKTLDKIILQVMSGTVTQHDGAALLNIAEDLVAQGAEGIILGCTELPLAAQTISFPLPLVDSMQSLIRSTLQFAYKDCDRIPENKMTNPTV